MKFSIIIPVRTINEYLRENISYLKKVDYSDFEVIIITDVPEKIDFGGDPRFILINSGPKGPGDKRNIGAKKATGEVLTFLDDDAYPSKDWLKNASKVFRDSNVYVLGTPAMTPKGVGFLEKCSGLVLESWLASGNTVYRHVPLKKRLIDDYPTVSLFVRKKAFHDVNGFDIDFWPGEDTKLCLDLVKKHGRKFDYNPTPIVYHHRRSLFVPYLKQVSRYGQHRGQFARIFPETSRLPFYFVPSIFILGLLFGPLVALVYPFLWGVYLSVLKIYLVLLIIESLRSALKDRDFRVCPFVMLGIFLTHIVYGINVIIGLAKKPKLTLRKFDKRTGKYLGG